MSGSAGMRMGFAVDGTLLVPSGGTTNPYGLELAFAYGNGPATVTFGPQPDQKPLSIGGMITQLAAMLGIEDLGTVASLQASPPWDALFDVAVQPRLSVTLSNQPAVSLVLDLYENGKPGIALPGGHMPSWLKIEPDFTVYSLLVGYDSASGIDLRAKVAFAPQKPATPPALPAGAGAGAGDGADPAPPPKTELVSFPFPVPAPPSNGLQVKYFGLGQRFGPTVDLSAADPMAALFDDLEKTFTTNDPTELLTKLAGYYHPDRDWFAAAHVLLRGWEVRAVFNDPALYGLEITSTAATFNGLLLEILYQKLGDGLGVYYGELTLPVQYRTIQLGVVALTIPTFKIWIYTNGDFKVSVGWPIGEGSIGIQVYVFTGGGGFYFAKLRSGDQPQSGGQALLAAGAAGAGEVKTYNPILEFGLGAWFGLGRSISSGPFSAQLSLVLQGTFQGILAWEAADRSGGGSSISRAPDYYWFAATVSVIGTLQGAVDLVVIKLSVYVRLSITAGIALEQGCGSTVLVSASVDVSASVKIVFFTISVGFSTTITETFTIAEGSPQASLDGPQNPAFKGMNDWASAAAGDVAPLAAAVAADRLALLAGDAPAPVAVPAAPTAPVAVGLTFLLQPSAVYDADGAGTPCGVAGLTIACPPSGGGDGGATDLGTLADALAAWLLRTYGPDGQWATVVTALGQGSAGPPDGWDAALTAFLTGAVAFTIAGADLAAAAADAAGDGDGPTPADVALFPMFAALQVAVGDGAPVPFATTGQTYANYADVVASYFAELALTVVSAAGAAGAEAPAADPPPPPDGPALTQLLFDDYFLTFARQLAREQAAAAVPSATVSPAVVANLGGLTSRTLLGGLRLPDPATTPPAPPIDLPALTIGAAYALGGQQLAVDAAQASCAATLSLGPDAGPFGAGAIAFAGGATSVTSTMPVAPAPPAPVPAWSGPSPGDAVGAPPADGAVPFTIVAPPPAHAQDRSVAIRTRLPWAQPGGATPFLVPLPPELTAAAATQGPLTATITTDDAPPKTLSCTPALLVSFTVHLVDRPRDGDTTASPYVPCVYRIDGADDATRDRIGAALAQPGALDGAQLAVLYPAATAGFRSGTLDPATPPLVAKTNLSTATEPGAAGAADVEDAAADPTAVLGPTAAPLTDPADVLRLLWEVGVVRTEGFYLRYRDAAGNGLPDALFSSPTQPAVGGVPTGTSATITLAVTFPQQTKLQPWHDTLLMDVDPSYTGTLHVAPAGPSGPLQDLAPSFPPGCVAFTGTYDPDGLAQDADPAPPFTPAWAEHLYHLLQFQVTGAAPQTTPGFAPSLWSLGVGPTADADAGGASTYRQVIPAYRFATGAGTTPNPYTSVGGAPVLSLRLVDVYGNALDVGTHDATFDVMYNDPLWPPSQWPGVRLSYTMTGTPRAAQLVLTAELDPTSLIGSGADQTQAALSQYATIADQLADPRTTVALTATMLPGFDGGAALKPQLAQAAGQFAAALASGAKDPVRMGWPIAIDPSLLAQADADVLPVTVTVALSRPVELVYKDADGRCVPGSDAVAQPVPANLDPPPGGTPRAQARAVAAAAAGGAADAAAVPDDVGLTAFAQAFEAVFAGFDGADGAARLAVRSDPEAPGATAAPALWLLRDSAADGVRVTPTVGEAAFFSLAPLATNLEGGAASVPTYDAQLQPTPVTQTFAAVDLDAWAQTFLAALDRVLTPDVATLIAAGAPSCFSELMLAKSVVAQALAAGVEPVYDTGAPGVLAGDLVGARDAFEQAVLSRLSDGYAIASVVQVPTAVAVADPAPDPALATRLFGSIDGAAPTGGTPPGLTLSAAKLPLVPATTQQPSFLSFLASVDDGGAAANVTAALTWTPGFAEQPAPEPADAYGYQPSRWLRFALDTAPVALGTATIPIPARAFPAEPVLTGQTATQTPPAGSGVEDDDPLAPYLRWDLGTTLVLPQALPQDMLGVTVTYNEPLTAASGLFAGDAPVPTLFEALASFTTAWPALAPYVLALAAAADGAPVDGVALPTIAGAIWEQVQPVARAWAALRGIPDPWSDGSEPAGAAAAPPAQATDTYMIDFQDAYAPTGAVVHVYSQGSADGGGTGGPDASYDDGASIVWPDVDGVAPTGTPVPVTDPPGPGTGWYRLDYAYTSNAGPDAPTALALTWPSLDALARQTARTGFWVTRNARLSGEDDPIPMNPNFVYRTPEVSYPDPVIPALTVPRIGPLPAGATLSATLQDALSALAAAGAAASTDRLLKLSLVHRFPVGGVPTASPILLADQVRLVPDGEQAAATDAVTLATLCGMLDADAAAWHAYFTPPAEGTVVGVALTLFADVAGARLPVLVITDLELTVGAGWWPKGQG